MTSCDHRRLACPLFQIADVYFSIEPAVNVAPLPPPPLTRNLSSLSSLSYIFPPHARPPLASYLPSSHCLSAPVPSFIVHLHCTPRGLRGQCILPLREGPPEASYRSGSLAAARLSHLLPLSLFLSFSPWGAEAPHVQRMPPQCF